MAVSVRSFMVGRAGLPSSFRASARAAAAASAAAAAFASGAAAFFCFYAVETVQEPASAGRDCGRSQPRPLQLQYDAGKLWYPSAVCLALYLQCLCWTYMGTAPTSNAAQSLPFEMQTNEHTSENMMC